MAQSMRIDLAPATTAPGARSAEPDTRSTRRRSLFGPWVDFATLGGGSFIVLAAMAAVFPEDEASRVALAGVMFFLAHFVNHPHFAHSYQLFYKDFRAKAFSPDSVLATRYRFAGIMVPAVLATFFAVALAQGNAPLLGLAANVMFLTVGWHYAKQGFGILMLDAALKGIRFSADERRRLLLNTHLVWVTYWLAANDALSSKELWGLTYYLLDVPDPLLVAMAALAVVSTLAVGRDLFLRWRAERTLPLNGLAAYAAAVYVWLLVGRLDPVLLLLVPFFHSLQYMAVVWRYQLNVEEDRRHGGPHAGAQPWTAWIRSAPAGLARFAIVGGILGAAGFWWAPVAANALSGYDRAVFGATLFLFVGWTFINIHHYFIDNVIWRRENPETRRHLFTASGRPAPNGGRGGQTHADADTAGSLRSTPT